MSSFLPFDTAGQSETTHGYRATIGGAIVPSLSIQLTPGQTIYFEHDTLLWKSVDLGMGSRVQLQGMFKRLMSGMDLIITEARGPGRVALSRDVPGEIRAIPLGVGQELHVRERAFLAASTEIDYVWERAGGVGTMLFGGTGLVIDRFYAANRPGMLWIHGGGNIIEMDLAPGEQIDVEAGGWLYKEPSVGIELVLAASFLASANLFCTRLTGPGRIAIQTLYEPSTTAAGDAPQNTAENAIAGVAGALISSFFRR